MDNWEAQVRKGVLEFCLLELLGALGQSYGYELLQRLRKLPAMDVTESAVYPVLSRMTRDALVTVWKEKSPSGPPRRWYRLTRSGHARLDEMRLFVKDLNTSLDQLLADEDGASRPTAADKS